MKGSPSINLLFHNRFFTPLFFIALFAANIIFSLTIIRHQTAGIESLEGSINDLRKRGDPLKYGREKTAGDVAAFMKRLPSEDRLTAIIRGVLDAARKNDLSVPAGEYSQQTVKDGDVSRYVMTFPVEGSYPHIKKFIYDVEMLRQTVAIEEMTLKGGSTETEALRLNIKISVYYL